MNKLNPNQTDTFFSQALNSPPKVSPSDKEWEVMERLLKPEPKRTVVVWAYWTAGIAAALLVFFALWFLPENIVIENQQAKSKAPTKQSDDTEDRIVIKKKAENGSIANSQNEPRNGSPEISEGKSAISLQGTPLYSNPFIIVKTDQPVQEQKELNTPLREPYVQLSSAIGLGRNKNNLAGIANNIPERDPAINISGSGFSANITTFPSSSNENPSPQNPAGKWTVSLALSPDLNTVKGLGNSSLGMSLGMGLDYKIGKSISASTGLFYSQKTYSSDKTSYKVKEKPFATWTSYSQKIDADCRVLDIPLNLNIKLQDKAKRKIHASAGLSSYIFLSEKYNFIYNPSPAYPAKGREYTIRNANQHILSIVNLSLGIEKPLTKQVSLVIQPYAKIPLTGIGQGETNLKSFGVGFQLNYSLRKKHALLKSNR